MQIPYDVSYRDVDKTDALAGLIDEKVGKLEEVCDHISSCHIAVEKTHDHPKSGSPYRVRLDITVPPGHEIAVVKSPDDGVQYDPVDTVIRSAFDAAVRQLKELNDRQNQHVKTHPEQQIGGIVTKLFPEEGYGFLKSMSSEDIYFHQNSVLNGEFDRLTVGSGVQFFVTEGEDGPQASTVRLVSKPGDRVGKAEAEVVAQPLGWS